MASDNFSSEVTRSFDQQGWIVRADPVDFLTKQYRAMGQKFGGERNGAADRFCLKDGYGITVEIKAAKLSFRFENWREEQRQWAEWAELERGVAYYIWLIMGPDPPNRNPAKYKPRRAWLIPRRAMLAVEQQVPQGSLPYRAGKGYGKELQEMGIDAESLLQPYALKWNKGIWRIHKDAFTLSRRADYPSP